MSRPGGRVGPYEVVRELGRGGMGVVLECRAPDGAAVALKLALGQAGTALARFRREARLQAGLGLADGFVPLLDHGDGATGPYLVMPLLRGGSLRDRIRNGPLAIEQAVALVQALAEASGRAHARGIVHRDLKPDNVLFGDDDRPLIADLGLAKHWDQAAPGASQSVALSRAGEMRGSVAYAAPEQIGDARSVGPPADVWALGAILHELVTGAPAFGGDSVTEVVARVLAAEPEPIRALRSGSPRWLEAVILRALSHDPAARYADGAELAAALAAGDAGGEARSGRSVVVVVVAITAALAALGAAGLALARRGEAEARQARLPGPEASPPASASVSAPVSEAVIALPEVPLDPAEPIVVRAPPAPAETATLRLDSPGVASTSWNLGGRVHCMALTPDGRRAIVGRLDGVVACADLASGALLWLRTVPRAPADPHTPPEVYAVATTPAGRTALSGGTDDAVSAWDVVDGALRWRCRVGSQVFGLAVDPAGARVAVAATQGVHVLDLASGRPLATLAEPPGQPRAVAWALGGQVLVGGGHEGALRLWDGADLRPLGQLGEHANHCMAVSPDGTRLLTGGFDPRVLLWDVAGRKLEAELPVPSEATRCLAFTPDGRRALAGGHDSAARLLDLTTRAEVRTLGAPRSFVMGVGVSAQGRAVVTGWDGRLRLCDLESGADVVEPVLHGGPVSGVATLAGDLVLSGADDGTLRVLRPGHGGVLTATKVMRVPSGVRALAVSPDRTFALTTSIDGVSRMFEVGPGVELFAVRGHGPWVHCAAFDPTGRTIATGGADGTVRLWDAFAGGSLGSLVEGAGEVVAVAFERPGRVFAADAASKLRALELEDRDVVIEVPARILALAIPSERPVLIEGDVAGVVRLRGFGGAGRREPRAMPTLPDAVLAVAATPDGRLVAAACRDGAVTLWDPAEGREVDRIDLAPSFDHPTALCLEADGELTIGTARGQVLVYRRRPRR